MDIEGFEDLEELYNLEQSQECSEDYEVVFSSESDNDSDIEVDNYANPAIVIMELQNVNVIEQKNGKKAFELTDKQRQHIVQELILAQEGKRFSPGGKSIPKGSIRKLAHKYNVHRTTIGRIWSKAKVQFGRIRVIDVCTRKRERGRKKLEFDPAVLAAVPVDKRTTIRALSEALHLSNTAVYSLLRTGILRAHTNSIKPLLKHHHKVKRVQFIINSIIPGIVNELPKFTAMYNMVHIDEKWFFMSDKTQRFYLFPWEDDPYRATQSKTFMEKVMVMAGTPRPHICSAGEIFWDGKIGVCPFTELVVAKKNSKNRAAGTVETEALQSVTKSIIRSVLIEKMLPAIRSKWPLGACKEIWIQQDNARPHISPNDTEFVEAATKDGFNIKLITQPAQSPDPNILDLGFFRAIQSIQYMEFARTFEELLHAIENAYNAYDPKSLNYTWLHMQYCMLEIIQVNGGNDYKNPYKGKRRLERRGQLPVQIEVSLMRDILMSIIPNKILMNTICLKGFKINIEDNYILRALKVEECLELKAVAFIWEVVN